MLLHGGMVKVRKVGHVISLMVVVAHMVWNKATRKNDTKCRINKQTAPKLGSHTYSHQGTSGRFMHTD